jgi:hypothetical protein
MMELNRSISHHVPVNQLATISSRNASQFLVNL